MNKEVRDALSECEGEWIQDCCFIIVNVDLTEVQDCCHNCETFKEAEEFINTISQDQDILRRIYIAITATKLDREFARLIVFEFDNYDSVMDFISRSNWLMS